ncbi:MAG: Cys-tRNA(Pro) deacylase [Clostridiales bacterium]|nr:Cys-tRNA(Pro) deacylase [Clostridiales bacterium]
MKKKAKEQGEKTNVMRILEQQGIPYTAMTYPHKEGVAVDGVTVARSLGQDPETVFKTLVTRGASGTYYVFDLPVAEELDLKKAARAVGEKNIAMLPLAQLLPLTGYVRGGCSPVGMKKPFFTTFHETAILYDAIAVSAGKIGVQVLVEPNALCQAVGGQFADIVKE